MSVNITAVHMSTGGYRHEHIKNVKWTKSGTSEVGESTRAQMVEFIQGGGKAYVSVGLTTVEVRWVNANPPYIQTYADGILTDNLLELPRY